MSFGGFGGFGQNNQQQSSGFGTGSGFGGTSSGGRSRCGLPYHIFFPLFFFFFCLFIFVYCFSLLYSGCPGVLGVDVQAVDSESTKKKKERWQEKDLDVEPDTCKRGIPI